MPDQRHVIVRFNVNQKLEPAVNLLEHIISESGLPGEKDRPFLESTDRA